MSWFYLALLAPLFFAVTNLIDDNLVQSDGTNPYTIAIVSGFFGCLPLLSRPFMHAASLPWGISLLALGAGFFMTLFYYFYFKALEVESPSVVIALFSLSPATVPVLAHFILHEQLLGLQIVGLVIVLLASTLLTLKKGEKFKFSKAIVPALTAVVLIDAATIMSKHAYDHASFYPVYMWYSVGLGMGSIYLMQILYFSRIKNITKGLQTILKKYLFMFIMAEAFALAAEFCLNLAISRGPVSLVTAIGGAQPMFVLLIAILLGPVWPKALREAKEGGIAKKIVLMAVIVAGLVLIQVA